MVTGLRLMWEGMAAAPPAESQTEAKARIQNLLVQALTLLNEAKELGNEWSLGFEFLGESFRPDGDDVYVATAADIEVSEWHASWSPGC